jgi:hypothetical protein
MKNIFAVLIFTLTMSFVQNSFAAIYPPKQIVCKKIDSTFSCDGLDSYYFNVSFYQIDNLNTPVIYTLTTHGHKLGWYWGAREQRGEFLYENSSSQFLNIQRNLALSWIPQINIGLQKDVSPAWI